MSNHENTLVELYRQAHTIEQAIIENNGELTPELDAALMNIETNMAEKLDGYAFVLDRMKSSQEFWKAESEKTAALAKACATIQSRIKERLKFIMSERGQKTCEGNKTKFTLSATKGSFIVGDEEAIPEKFKTATTVYVVDRERVRTAIEAGEEVPGAWIIAGHQLRITKKKAEL